MPQLAKPRLLLDGLAIGESPRWHDGRLWLCNWGVGEIVAVGLDGSSEVVARGPELLGWSIGWLADGRMLITGEELVRVEPDGSRVRHADLGHISPYGWNELTVDGRGNVYVNTINFDFAEFGDVLTTGKAPGKIALVTPDGEAREVASEMAFPNCVAETGLHAVSTCGWVCDEFPRAAFPSLPRGMASRVWAGSSLQRREAETLQGV